MNKSKILKLVRIVVSFILSFALMLAIIGSSITILSSKLLSKDYILKKFDDIDLYAQVYKEVQLDFENYIYQSGIEMDAIKNVCNEDKVKNDIIRVIESLYSGEEFEIDTSKMQEELDKSVDEVIEKENRKISEEEKFNINNFKITIIQSYKNTISVYGNLISSFQNSFASIMEKVAIVRNISIVAVVVLMISIIILNLKNIIVRINYICISFLASGMVLLLTNWLINSKIEIDNLVLTASSLTNAVITIIKEFLNSVLAIGMWCILIGFVGILVIAITRMDKNPDGTVIKPKKEKVEKDKVKNVKEEKKKDTDNEKKDEAKAEAVPVIEEIKTEVKEDSKSEVKEEKVKQDVKPNSTTSQNKSKNKSKKKNKHKKHKRK